MTSQRAGEEAVAVPSGDAAFVREMSLARRGAAGDRVPWHKHTHCTGRCYCLAGRVQVRTATECTVLAPGESTSVAPGVAHEIRNALLAASGAADSDGTSRYLLVQSGGDYDFVPVPEPAVMPREATMFLE